MSKVFQMIRKEENDTTELLIHGELYSLKWQESDVSSFDIADELSKITTRNLVVRINSYGGEVAVGLAIYNLLKSFKGKVTTINDGFACSAASVVFMAGSERIMPKSSVLMIHNAWTYAEGDSKDLRKTADDLEKITQPIVSVYVQNSNLSESVIKRMMDQEEWITAEEAVSYGFATKIQEDGPKMSLESNFLYRLVAKTKDLEKLLEAKETVETKEDLWSSYFNPSKGKN